MTIQRIQWTCPICKRRYAIPATAPTPSRCPAVPAGGRGSAPRGEATAFRWPRADDDAADNFETSALSALAAIQLEVAEEAARGPTVAAPVLRHVEAASSTLPHDRTGLHGAGGLAVVVAFAGSALRFARRLRHARDPRANGFDLRGDRRVWRRTRSRP